MAAEAQASWRLEPMLASDMPEVMAIERESHPTAWPEALFLGELTLSWARVKVLRDASGAMLGYIDYWLVHDELHVLNVAVAAAARRRGCGRYLMEAALADGLAHGVEYVTLEVRVNNASAIAMYVGMGFVEAGRRRGYYADTGEDALILALELSTTERA